MSPSEADLRAALRDGEGDGFSADRVVIAAQRRRAQRRSRMLTTAASIVVVAAIGGGVTAIARSGSSNQSGASNGGARAAVHGSAAEPSAAAAGRGADFGEAAHVACPATFPHYALPGGGSPGQFGSDGPLFTKPVASVVVCGYASSPPARLVLTASDATRLVASMETAAKTPVAQTCPLLAQHRLAIVGLTADGARAGTVTAVWPQTCGAAAVTNGTAVRYDWTPPADVASAITSALASQASVPPGIMHGSPVAS